MKYSLTLALLIPVLASAHGLATTQSRTIGDYLIEFEYNTLGNILTGDYTLFNAYLLNPSTRDGIDFDSAFIRIEKQGGPAMLAGNLAEASDIKGYASISGVLNDPGTYTAEVSFFKVNKILAESKFNFIVEKNQYSPTDNSVPTGKPYLPMLMFAAGLAAGAAAVAVVWKKKLKTHNYSKRMKNSFWAALAGLLILVGIFYFLFRSNSNPTTSDNPGQVQVTESQPVEIAVNYINNSPFEPKSYTVAQGQKVSIKVTSDTADELHFHGYELRTDLEAGKEGMITFTADQTGRFEFELENLEKTLGVIDIFPK